MLALLVVNKNKTKHNKFSNECYPLVMALHISEYRLGQGSIYGIVQHSTNFSKAPYELKNEVTF